MKMESSSAAAEPEAPAAATPSMGLAQDLRVLPATGSQRRLGTLQLIDEGLIRSAERLPTRSLFTMLRVLKVWHPQIRPNHVINMLTIELLKLSATPWAMNDSSLSHESNRNLQIGRELIRVIDDSAL